MARYYALLSGLPELTVDDRKLPFNGKQLLGMLDDELNRSDRALLNVLLYEDLNREVLDYINDLTQEVEGGQDEAVEVSERSPLINWDELRQLVQRDEAEKFKAKSLPRYLQEYIKDRMANQDDELDDDDKSDQVKAKERLALEDDRLALYYYDSLLNHKNRFVADWARMNMNIRNILAASTCRKLGWKPEQYVIGYGSMEQKLIESKARDFGIAEDEMDDLGRVLMICDETDITRRERAIDLLRWNWIDDQVFFTPFDKEAVLAYYLKLSIIERWTLLNDEQGELTFRQIVTRLNSQSSDALNEFRNNQRKK